MEQIRTRIVYGPGFISRIGDITKEYGNNGLIICSRKNTEESGLLRKIRPSFQGCIHISSNPTAAAANAGIFCYIRELYELHYDYILAVGGGSVMDAAKVIAMGIKMGIKAEVFLNGYKPENSLALPIIAVPTMAASGSETNGGYVLTVDGLKRGSSAWAAIPKVAILDPELTLSVPKDLTSYGLIDAYSHVLEGYLHGEKKSPVADAMAEAVMERIANVAERLYDDPSDMEARGEAMLLSNVANDGGLNIGRGKVEWKIHEKAHQRTDIYHGKAVAIAMLDYFKEKDGELYEGMVKWFARIGVNPMA